MAYSVNLPGDEDPRFSLSARPCFACAPARVFLKSCGKSAQGLNANFGVKSWMIQLRLANVDWSVGLKSKCQTEHLQPNRKIMGILWDINSQMLNNLWANDLDQEEPLISSFFFSFKGVESWELFYPLSWDISWYIPYNCGYVST